MPVFWTTISMSMLIWDDRVSRGFVQHELPGLCKKGAAVVIKYIIVNCGFQICWY